MQGIRLKRRTLGIFLGTGAFCALLVSMPAVSAVCQVATETTSKTNEAGKSKDAQNAAPAKLKKTKLGKTRNVTLVGKNLLCGQPTQADLKLAKQQGVQSIVTLRESSEIDWDEAAAAKALGLEYVPIPFSAPDTLKDDVFDKVREALQGSDEKPIMLHCGSANRVGAVWMAYRVLDENVPVEQAKKEAKQIGLRTEGYLDKAVDYIRRKQKSPAKTTPAKKEGGKKE